MLSFLFRCFFLFVPHLKTLAHELKPEKCVCFETSGPSLCIPALTMAARAKKNFWQSDLLTPSVSTVEIWSTFT